MRLLYALFLLAGPLLQFEVTDARGKQTSGIAIEAGAPDEDGWRALTVTKFKGEPVLVWPLEGLAKTPDGPGPVAAIVIGKGDARATGAKKVVAAIAAPVVLGTSSIEEQAGKTGLARDSLEKAFKTLAESTDAFEKGVGLLYNGKAPEAAEQLGIALKQRQRQLTRVPSEIYPVATLYGRALVRAGKFDDAAVAFLTALKQRPGDETARKGRAEALTKAGKPEAATDVP